MKIIYFFDHLYISGGIPKIISDKLNFLSENPENDIYLIYSKDEQSFTSFFPLNKKIKILCLNTQGNNNFFKTKTEKILKEIKPDICITIVYSDSYYFLHKIKDKSKKIAEFHTCFEFAKGFSNIRYNFKKALNEKLFFLKLIYHGKKYDQFVVLTDKDAKKWNKYLKNICIIPNFIDTDLFFRKINNRKNQAIAVGRLDGVKSFQTIISSWKYIHEKHPNYQLKIYGNGELKNQLLKQIADLNLKKVISINSATNNIVDIYSESSMLISSSMFEGLPMVILEAMANGLPIIMTKQRGGECVSIQ